MKEPKTEKRIETVVKKYKMEVRQKHQRDRRHGIKSSWIDSCLETFYF